MNAPARDYELDKILAEGRLDGSLIKGKARVLLEDFLDRLYPRLQDPDLATSTFLDAGEFLAKLADAMPKQGAALGAGGTGLSISFNFSNAGAPASVTVSHSEADAPDLLDITEFNPLPPRPPHIPVPDFHQNWALSAGFQALGPVPSALQGGLGAVKGLDALAAGTPSPPTQALPVDGAVVSRPFSVPVEITAPRLANPAQPA